MKTRMARRRHGSVLIESVIAISIILPLTVVIILVALEATHAYFIAGGMTQAAVLTCRALASEYRINRLIVSDTAAQQSIFSNIRIANLVHSNTQFQITQWNVAQDPKTVTVKITYISGAGTPPLPSFPSTGTLNLGSAFQISQAITYRLHE